MENYKKPNTRQSNVITSARHEYSLWEKRILNKIGKKINDDYLNKTLNKNLYNNIIKIPIIDITYGKANRLHEVKKASLSILKKTFEITENIGEKNERWEAFVLISYFKIENNIMEIEISNKVMPFLIEYSKDLTYARYRDDTADILQSTYTQRFYEFCCRFRDTGFWYISIFELRRILKLENKFKAYADFKRFVLNLAKTELENLYVSGKSDIYFTYEEIKEKRTVSKIKVKIIAIEKEKNKLTFTN